MPALDRCLSCLPLDRLPGKQLVFSILSLFYFTTFMPSAALADKIILNSGGTIKAESRKSSSIHGSNNNTKQEAPSERTIKKLINDYGKSKIIEIILKHRKKGITICVDGSFRDYLGPPGEQWVTAKSIVQDLQKAGLSLSKLQEELKESTAEKAHKQQEYVSRQEELMNGDEDDEGWAYARRELIKAELSYGKNSLKLSRPLSSLAEIHIRLGEYEEATEYLERLRTIQENALDKDDPKLMNTITRLDAVYGKLKSANQSKGSDFGGYGGHRAERSSDSHPSATSTAYRYDAWDPYKSNSYSECMLKCRTIAATSRDVGWIDGATKNALIESCKQNCSR